MIELHKKVRFRGEEYWLHGNKYCNGSLSPIDHYSDDGELLANPFHDISYAIIKGTDIMRFGEKIGDVSELEEKEND